MIRRVTNFSAFGNDYPLENVQSVDDRLATVAPRTRQIIGKDGGFDEFGGTSALAEIGVIRAEVILEVINSDPSDMADKLDLLNSLSKEVKGFLYATMEDESVRWCIARTRSITAPQSEQGHTGILLRARVEFEVADPYWYAQGTEAPAWGYFNWGGASWGGMALPHDVSGTSTDFTVTVAEGNVTTQPRIRIVCGAGQTAQNIQIQRRVDGAVVDEVLYTGTLTEGDVLEINSRKMGVYLNGADDFDNLTWMYRSWFELEPGDNDVRVILANGGDACQVTFNYLYRWV